MKFRNALVVLVLSLVPAALSAQSVISRVRNATWHLVVTMAEIRHDTLSGKRYATLYYSLKNTSTKAVTAYTVSTCNGMLMTVDSLTTSSEWDGRIQPGKELTELSSALTYCQDTSGALLSIVQVTFDDGSSEGDENLAAEVRASRLGTKESVDRGLATFRQLLEIPEQERRSFIDQRIGALKKLVDQPRLLSRDPMISGTIKGAMIVLPKLTDISNVLASPGAFQARVNSHLEALEKLSSRIASSK